MDTLFPRMATLFYIILITIPLFTKSVSLSNMCVTPICVQAAGNILEKMDQSINPCDNFYKFTCGQFLNSTYTRPGQKMFSWKSAVQNDIVPKLASLLYSKISKNDIKLFRQTKQLYKQCLDRKTIAQQEDKNVLDIINKFGGWPVVMGDNWNSTDIDWIKTPSIFSKARSYVVEGYFLSMKLTTKKQNSTKNYYEILPMHHTRLLRYPVKNFTNYSDDSVYYNFLVKYAVKLGAEEDRARKELMQAMKFENDLLYMLQMSVMELYGDHEDSDNFMTIGEMMEKWPTIEWLTYINNIFSISSDIKKINKNETVIVNCPIYVTNLEELIRTTPKRVIINYSFARIVVDLLELTDPSTDIFSESKKFEMNNKNIWRDCFMQTGYNLPEIVTALYVRNVIREDAKIEALNIVSNIKFEMIKMINEAKWLDEEIRNNASKKILSVDVKMGYPDLYRDDKNITELFRDLQLDESTYLHNLWKISRFNISLILRDIRNDDEYFGNWVSILNPIYSINAFYTSTKHVFSISPDDLQSPIDKRQPTYMNYGRMGSLIGHELIHVIDRLESFIDKDKAEKDLWIKSCIEEYLKRVNCLINQYDNYTVEGTKINLNGTLSQYENLADITGVKISYSAYENWSSHHESELILPGLNFTSSQMFWINYASQWCTAINPDYLNQLITADGHSLPEFRVVGTLSNIPEFSKDFNCPLNSLMNPEKKCVIW